MPPYFGGKPLGFFYQGGFLADFGEAHFFSDEGSCRFAPYIGSSRNSVSMFPRQPFNYGLFSIFAEFLSGVYMDVARRDLVGNFHFG